MPRYKGRASAKEIEKDFPHIVEMRVPLGGFCSKLNAMHSSLNKPMIIAFVSDVGLPGTSIVEEAPKHP